MFKNKKIIIMAIAAAVLLSGCAKISRPDPENGYSTNYAMSGIEYSIYISEQVAAMENILMTRLTMAESVLDNSYDPQKEVENTKEALRKMTSINTNLLTTMPAQGYESDREAMLGHAQDMTKLLERYQTALENNNTQEIESCAQEMSAVYLAVSGEANMTYE